MLLTTPGRNNASWRWLHTVSGLFLTPFLVWMGISGIILNHPGVASHFSIPANLVPSQYLVHDWSRGALTTMVFSARNPSTGYVGGKQGVWETKDYGYHFRAFMNGFPLSGYFRKTNSLLLLETTGKDSSVKEYLFAGTDGGLFLCDITDGNWKRIRLEKGDKGHYGNRVLRVLRTGNGIVAITPSFLYFSGFDSSGRFNFSRIIPNRSLNTERIDSREVSFITAFFGLHSGKAWGILGRLLYDIVGLSLIFLSLSSFYTWFFRKKVLSSRKNEKKYFRKTNSSMTLYRDLFRLHSKVGIWVLPVLLIIGGTGLFMRPPLIAAIVDRSLPRKLYPAPFPKNPWNEKIHNALYNPEKDTLLLETADGFWEGPADFNGVFRKKDISLPVFVMGSTYFDRDSDGCILAASFNGLFRYNPHSGAVTDLLEGKDPSEISNVKPSEIMISGFFTTPEGNSFAVSQEGGLIPIGDSKLENGRFRMPGDMKRKFRMPLWNYMFELHNGRIFKGLLGDFYILIVPAGAFLFLLKLLTGTIDWLQKYHR